jgi:hypothetical protein
VAQPAPAPAQSAQAASEWRNHPVVIAAVSASAALVLALGYFSQVALPTQTAKLEIALLKSNERVDKADKALADAQGRIASDVAATSKLQSEAKAADARIKLLEGQLTVANTSNFLSPGNPYPVGIGLARIGMPLKQVLAIYAGNETEWDADESYLTVKIKNHPISEATYFIDEKSKSVSHIMFRMAFRYPDPHPFPAEFLRNRLLEALGQPAARPRPTYYRWNVANHWNVFMSDDDNYVVMKSTDVLAMWPDEG